MTKQHTKSMARSLARSLTQCSDCHQRLKFKNNYRSEFTLPLASHVSD